MLHFSTSHDQLTNGLPWVMGVKLSIIIPQIHWESYRLKATEFHLQKGSSSSNHFLSKPYQVYQRWFFLHSDLTIGAWLTGA